MAFLIKANGSVTEVHPAPGSVFALQQLQEWVGGYIEVVATHTGDLMILNEEGKLHGLPYNAIATERYQYGEHDPVVGDVLICKLDEVNEPEEEEEEE